MNNIIVIFDLSNMVASFEYKGQIINKKIRVCDINDFTKMASISFFFNDNFKWVFSWSVWCEREQFIKFSQYKKVNEKDDPWIDLVKWSYISKPSRGTVQTDKVYRMFYEDTLFPEVNNIFVEIKGSPYGDWNTSEFTSGYYY